MFLISSAVVNALKNLQRKINQMELQRKQAETNYQQLSHDVKNRQQVSSPYVEPGLPTANQPGPDSCNREGDRGVEAAGPIISLHVITSFVV